MTIDKELFVPAGKMDLALANTFLEWLDSLTHNATQDSTRCGRKPEQEWRLTEEALTKLLVWLHPEASPAAEEYQKVRERLVRYFDSNGCVASDACADLTIDRVAKRIMEGEVQETVPRKVSLDLGKDKKQRPFAVIEGFKAGDLVIAVPSRTADSPVTHDQPEPYLAETIIKVASSWRACPVKDATASNNVC
jgi:hypothetical protein